MPSQPKWEFILPTQPLNLISNNQIKQWSIKNKKIKQSTKYKDHHSQSNEADDPILIKKIWQVFANLESTITESNLKTVLGEGLKNRDSDFFYLNPSSKHKHRVQHLLDSVTKFKSSRTKNLSQNEQKSRFKRTSHCA